MVVSATMRAAAFTASRGWPAQRTFCNIAAVFTFRLRVAAPMLHRHRHLTAWLGVLAIWFAIAAPLVSQWRVAQAAVPEAVVCSTEHRANSSAGAGRTHDHALHLDACGYCGFFAHSPAIGGAAAAAFAAVPAAFVNVAAPRAGVARADRYPRAYPRAPPERA
jgi:hypothetical protein